MNNKVQLLFDAITKADIVEVEGIGQIRNVNPCPTDEPGDEILYLYAVTDEGEEYSIWLTERGLENAHVEGNVITCDDNADYETNITLYKKSPYIILPVEPATPVNAGA